MFVADTSEKISISESFREYWTNSKSSDKDLNWCCSTWYPYRTLLEVIVYEFVDILCGATCGWASLYLEQMWYETRRARSISIEHFLWNPKRRQLFHMLPNGDSLVPELRVSSVRCKVAYADGIFVQCCMKYWTCKVKSTAKKRYSSKSKK